MIQFTKNKVSDNSGKCVKTPSYTSRKMINWYIILEKQSHQNSSVIVIINPQNFVYLFCLFCLNSTSILLCSVGSLKTTFLNRFSQWKALALGKGRKKEVMCPCPLASRCAPNRIRNQYGSCSGCVAPAHSGRGLLLTTLVVLTLSRDLVLLEATTSVSAFKFPCYITIKSGVGFWIFWRLQWCGEGSQENCRIFCRFRGRAISQYVQHNFAFSAYGW